MSRKTVDVEPGPNRSGSGAGRRALGPDLVLGRLAGAGLLAWMAWIHLHLWSDGYKHLHVIGALFLLNFIGGVVVALALLASPARLLPFTAAAATLTAGITLVSLAVSINNGLFGFKDSYNAPFVHLSIWAEGLALAVGALLTARSVVAARSPAAGHQALDPPSSDSRRLSTSAPGTSTDSQEDP